MHATEAESEGLATFGGGSMLPMQPKGGYAAGTAMTTNLSYSYSQEFPQLVQRYVECMLRELSTVHG